MTHDNSNHCSVRHDPGIGESTSEACLNAILSNAPDVIARFDKNLRYLYVNSAIERLTGKPREYFIGKTNKEIGMPEELANRWSNAICEVFRTGEEVTIEFDIPTPKGIRTLQSHMGIECDSDDAVLSVIAVIRDVTDMVILREKTERALHESQKAMRWISAMEGVAEAGISPIGMDDLLRIIAERVTEVLDADSCHILMLDEDTGEFVSRVSRNVPEPPNFRTDVRQGFEGRIYAERRTAYVEDAEHDPLVTDPYLKRAGVKSLLGTPLIVRGRIVGVIYVDTLKVRQFSREDVRLLEDMAFRAALVIENARLRGELEAHGEEVEATLVKEVYLSRLLQRALLPIIPEKIDGLLLASIYIPAYAEREIGGDFYDVFSTRDGKTGILVGDVSGKGLESASLAAATRSTVRAFAYGCASPADILQRANEVLSSGKEDPSLFVTVFLALIDRHTGELRYAGAGHPPGAIHHIGDGVEFLAYDNPPLALYEDCVFTEASTRIDPGDKLIIYTDGITEARHEGEMFGQEGVERALEKYGNLPPDELAGRLVAAAGDWARGHLTDDIAILVVDRSAGG